MRKTNDSYPTPHSLVERLVEKYIDTMGMPDHVWEPCVGDGRIAKKLLGCGVESVSQSDIQWGQDFFIYKKAIAPVIITNPPFKHIRPFIDHAFAIGVQSMALICGERLWACKRGGGQFERHKPHIFAMMDWREDYLGKGGSPDRSLAISIWQTPCAEKCTFEIWSK
jgi:hypothetical protein